VQLCKSRKNHLRQQFWLSSGGCLAGSTIHLSEEITDKKGCHTALAEASLDLLSPMLRMTSYLCV